MSSTAVPDSALGRPLPSGAVAVLEGAVEGLVVGLVVVAPWLYGGVHAWAECVLLTGVALVLLLWAVKVGLLGELSWRRSALGVGLAVLFFLAILQTVPVSPRVLAVVSPGTAALYERLLPAEPEQVTPGDPAAPPRQPSLSLYKGATLRAGLRLLAVFLLFSAVLNNVPAGPGLRRLSLACLVNGALLAAFALVQHYTSPPNTLYWSVPSLGRVFGPFINRNHFPFYVNMCIGLGVGLLVAGGRGRPTDPAGAAAAGAAVRRRLGSGRVWGGAALLLMGASVLVSLSRGGVFALLLAVAGCLAVFGRGICSGRFKAGFGVMAVLAVAAWVGLEQVAKGPSALTGWDTLANRWPLWARVTPAAREFPVLGTGLGTFRYVEPLYQARVEDSWVTPIHAHNEYLEVALELGAVGLLVALFCIAAVYRSGRRALRAGPRGQAGLVLGGLIAFTTVVLHSAVEFGLHIPAIVLLAGVLCAYLCRLGEGRPADDRTGLALEGAPARLEGLAGLVTGGGLVVLGTVLCVTGWKAQRAEDYAWAAAQVADRDGPPERRVALLSAAVRLTPEDGTIQLELGRAWAARVEQRLGGPLEACKVADVLAGYAAPGLPHALAAAFFTASPAKDALLRDRLAADVRPWRDEALRRFVQARDACPLNPFAHLELAWHADAFGRADPPERYLERVQLLAPHDPQLWYLVGLGYHRRGAVDPACQSWRRALELSPSPCRDIVTHAGPLLTTPGFAARLFPDDPALLLAAAGCLTAPAQAALQVELLERGLALVPARDAAALPTRELHARAELLRALGKSRDALACFRVLAEREPDRPEFHFVVGELSCSLGDWEAGRQALLRARAGLPDDPRVLQVLRQAEQHLRRTAP